MADDLSAQPFNADDVSRDEINRAFNEVLGLSSGKRVVFWLLEQAAIYRDAFAGEATASTNYTLGQQSVGRVVIAKLDELNPHVYPKLLIDIAELKSIDKAAAKALSDTTEEDTDEV